MKLSHSSTKRLALLFLVLALAALACQTVMGGFDPATPTPVVDIPATQIPLPQDTDTPQPTDAADTPVPTEVPTATPTLVPVGKNDQLDIFQELWEIINEEYLYADFNGVDWDGVYDDYKARIEAGMDTAEFYVAMDDMIWALGDEHSVFLNPQQVVSEEAEYDGGNDYVGIGVWLQFVPDRDKAVILLVFPGGPAEAAGLKSRDSILSVEGQAMDDESGAAIDLLLGPEGSEVTFVVQTPGEDPRTMTLQRGRISGSLPVPFEVLQTPLGQRIGYILIPSFSDSQIGPEVGDALEEMTADASLDGIIIDNRLNGGGWSDVMSTSLSYFADGLMGYFTNRNDQEALRVSANDIGGSSQLPLAVLVGPDTVSFGEVFSGILKDQGRATLIGETTGGNVEILWGYNFLDGSRAWIAHDTFKPVNDANADWENEGIVVDIEAPAEWDMYTVQTDPAVVAALAHFDQQ